MQEKWKLTGRVALVTGASQGFGFAIAMTLAGAGADVAILARRPDILLEARDRLMTETGAKVIAIPGDVADASLPQKAVAQIKHELGSIDILVNNTGGPKPGPFIEMTQKDWQNALGQNLLSMVLFSQAVIPSMKTRGWGRIINIASTAAKEPVTEMVLSNATRAAVVAVSKTMSLELSKFGITVNTVCPGPAYTDRGRYLIARRCETESLSEEQVVAQIVANVPIGRMAQPDEIAFAVGFLASDLASYITGIVLPVDGGLTRSLY
ncbi:SDR family oxidoreductase [Chloroflexota bacterium]